MWFVTKICRRDTSYILGTGQVSRYRLGDVIAFCQMHCEATAQMKPVKPFSPTTRKMSEIEKVLGRYMKVDLAHPPMSLE